MAPPRLEVAEVFRQHQDEYIVSHSVSPEQRRVIRDLITCRTAALGGHLRRCDTCGHEEIAYNGDVHRQRAATGIVPSARPGSRPSG